MNADVLAQNADLLSRRMLLVTRHVRDRKRYGPESNDLARALIGMMKHPLDTDEGVLLWEGLMLCCTAVLHAHDVERRRVPWEVLVAARRLGRWMIESVFGLEGIERWKSGQAIFTEKRTH